MTTLPTLRLLFLTVILSALPVRAQAHRINVEMSSNRFVYDPATAIREAAPQADANPTQALPYWVAIGDWAKVADVLATLPSQDAVRLHAQIVQGLVISANNPATAAVASDAPNRGGKQSTPVPSTLVGELLHPEDVLDLAEALPASCPIPNGTAIQLGQLLAKTIGSTGAPSDFIQRLRQGTAHLGGTNATAIATTVTLLLSSGEPELALTFLPTEPDAQHHQAVALKLLYQQCHLAIAAKCELNHDAAGAIQEQRHALSATIRLLDDPLPTPVAEALLKQLPELLRKTGDVRVLTAWLRDLIDRRDAHLPAVLATLASPIPPAGGQANYDARRATLALQCHIANLITGGSTDAASIPPQVHVALHLFAMNWASEADFSRGRLLMQPREITPGDARSFKPSFAIAPDLVKEIAPEELLQLAPNDGWDFAAAPDDVARLDNDRLALLMASGQRTAAMSLLAKMARTDSSEQAEQNVAGSAMTIWVLQNMPVHISISPFAKPPLPKGIPTARATQVRNLDAMVEMLEQVRNTYGRSLAGPLVVPMFNDIHSQAEVFTLPEIERVFGPSGDLDTPTLTRLAAVMQENLQKAWQSDQVQSANGTNRTNDQRMQQVADGFQTLTTLLERHLARQPDWRLFVQLAGARFQRAEIGLHNGNGFAPYTHDRNAAFDAIHHASTEYAKSITDLETGRETLDVYSSWFAMALGASDLAALDANDLSSQPELGKLRDAIRSLPGSAAKRHVDRFANVLVDQSFKLAPDVKERIVRNGLIVVGDSALANPLRSMMQSYADLLTELQFRVDLDGSDHVGNAEPFGLIASLDHTDSLEFETGGFGKYILSPTQGSPLADGRRSGVNYRDNFQKHLTEALGANFDVQNIVWAPVDVQSRPISARTGWRNTPLAYVVLKAKDPSIDRVPPVQLDVDFNDRMNMVILPVVSSMLMIDAATATARHASDLTIDQRLNDHELANGELKLEVRASGRGLMPDLSQLINLTTLNRFSVRNVSDGGLKVDRFDANPTDPNLGPAIISQRAWTLSLASNNTAGANSTFAFAAKADLLKPRQDVTMTFHRYDDADLVEARPTVPLHGIVVPATRAHGLLWGLSFASLAAIAVAAAVWRASRSPGTASPTVQAAEREPGSVFETLRMLRSLKRPGDVPPAERDQLDQDIRELESTHFSPRESVAEADLDFSQTTLIWNRWAKAK